MKHAERIRVIAEYLASKRLAEYEVLTELKEAFSFDDENFLELVAEMAVHYFQCNQEY